MTRPFTFALCADDYAMTPAVSRGIVEALEAGALSATSVMTTSPWWPETAGALRRHAERADIGLHLNLTLGAPLAPMPRLAPSGRLPSIGTLLRLARRQALPVDEIAAEIDRQAECFSQVLGCPPDHVDGHQHVQVLAGLTPILLDVLRRRGWHPWLRDSADGPMRILARRGSWQKALGLAVLGRGLRRQARKAGFATNDGFAGFSAFDPGIRYADQFARYLMAPGRRHLVMCHPGYIDDELRNLDPVVATREQELRFLLSSEFRDTLAAAGATIGRLSRPDQDNGNTAS